MLYLLDTNAWVHYLKNPDSIVAQRVEQTPVHEIAVCSIVWAELLHGARKYGKRAAREARVEETLRPHPQLAFDKIAAQHYAEIRDRLELRGEVIGLFDMQIAAIALAHDLTVVTNNVSEFRRVDGLRIEDWSVV